MEKKDVKVLLPTVENLQTMKSILNRAQFNDANRVFKYAFAKMVEWTIANGGLETCSLIDYPEEIAYLISRSVSLIYPKEQKFLTTSDVQTQDIYMDVLERDDVLDAPCNLDDLVDMTKDNLKMGHNFLERIIMDVERELYRRGERGGTIPNNLKYRFDHPHDTIVSALFAGELFNLFNGTPSEEIIERCTKIEPLYILRCKAEDLIYHGNRGPYSYQNEGQTCMLRGSIDEFAGLYRIGDMWSYGMRNIDSDTDLMNESDPYCKAIRGFFNKNGNSK